MKKSYEELKKDTEKIFKVSYIPFIKSIYPLKDNFYFNTPYILKYFDDYMDLLFYVRGFYPVNNYSLSFSFEISKNNINQNLVVDLEKIGKQTREDILLSISMQSQAFIFSQNVPLYVMKKPKEGKKIYTNILYFDEEEKELLLCYKSLKNEKIYIYYSKKLNVSFLSH